MKIERIPVDGVKVAKDHRKTNGETVAALAASMRVIGQLQPITVYEQAGYPHLIAGRHRLEAAEFLGWDDIEAVFVTGDEIDRRLREISENLHRAELTVQERAEQVAEWVDLVGQREKLSQLATVSKGGRGKEGGERKASRELGLDKDEVNRSRKIASIAPAAKEAAKAHGLDDTQSALLQVAKEPTPEKQVAKVVELSSRKKSTGTLSTKTWRDDFEKLWARGTSDDHKWARERIDEPVMDARYR